MDPIEVMAQAMFPSTFEGSVEMARETATTLVKALGSSGFVIVETGTVEQLRSEKRELFKMLSQFTTDA